MSPKLACWGKNWRHCCLLPTCCQDVANITSQGGRYELYLAAADDGDECNECDNKAWLREVANMCLGYFVVLTNLSALVWRAATLRTGRFIFTNFH
jgi:hypothetical protein